MKLTVRGDFLGRLLCFSCRTLSLKSSVPIFASPLAGKVYSASMVRSDLSDEADRERRFLRQALVFLVSNTLSEIFCTHLRFVAGWEGVFGFHGRLDA